MRDLSNENIVHVIKNGIQYIQFRKLLNYSDIINHAYAIGLDRNYRTTNKDENGINNYKDLCQTLNTNYINCVKPCLAHTANVKNVIRKINVDEADIELDEYAKTDGLITNKTNMLLATTNADCILLLLFDPVKKVIANIHSGWKGTLGRIAEKAVQNMKEQYGCNPQDIICCMSPSLRKCHFEVRADVQELYCNEFKDIKQIDDLIIPVPNEDKWKIDMVEINKIMLKQQGLKDENIIDSGLCSVCNSDLIHSYRVEGKGFGLCTAVIELK